MQNTMITIALRGITVLPAMTIQLDLSRFFSIEAAKEAMNLDQKVFLVTQKNTQVNFVEEDDLEHLGTIAQVKQIVKMSEHLYQIMVEGIQPAVLNSLTQKAPFLIADITPVEGEEEESVLEEAMLRVLREELKKYVSRKPKASRELVRIMNSSLELTEFTNQLVCNLPLDLKLRQKYLSICHNLKYRHEFLVNFMQDEVLVDEYREQFQNKIKKEIDKHQKEYILREQLRVIRQELGEDVTDLDEYMRKIDESMAPERVKEQLRKEVRRLRTFGGGQEAAVVQSYIETLLDIPWGIYSEENRSIKEARKVLEADHYGLDKVKECVIEYLAVRRLKEDGNGQILCLVGPPGTGKTSIAKSIAKALNRNYVRISLGGVRDEAEIRGHRRTYIASMPGRIADGIRKAKSMNPLMLLDELDKVGNDSMKGDTSAALLEVLDSAQNHSFHDHYLDVPLDLSKVLFIATANTLDTIPKPLLDRMEIISVSSYTENEKFHIAKKYLIPRQMELNGLPEGFLKIEKSGIQSLIRFYTREAGVRNLERKIGELCRKAVIQYTEEKTDNIRITSRNLEKYLGKQLVHYQDANRKNDVGIVRGLAWTAAGGDTLQIEVNTMPGKGGLRLTGSMGDVMKESAQIALSYVRSLGKELGLEEDYMEHHEIHIHIPEGAVPKDGPSAGVTMATALYSALTGKKVRADVAMTGEITLRGQVLPIGGLKEKLLAAKMAHIKKVLVPIDNTADVSEFSKEITDGMQIVFAETMKDVLTEAIVSKDQASADK